MKQRIKAEDLPDKRKIHRWIAGVDFGFDHPMAILIFGQRESKYYQYAEVYERKLGAAKVIDTIKKVYDEWGIEIFYCDGSRPELIEDLRNARLPAEPAIKDVFEGIMYIIGLIGKENLYVNKECNFTLREYDSYIWDAKNTVKEVPLKVNDDCMDASRYALYSDSRNNGVISVDVYDRETTEQW